MSANPGPEAAPRSRANLRWVAATLLLLFAGLPVCLLITLPLGVSVNPCGAGDVRLTCSTAVQLVLVWLPLIGLVLGLLICVLGGLRAKASGGSPGRAVLVGWVVFVVFEVAVLLLAKS